MLFVDFDVTRILDNFVFLECSHYICFQKSYTFHMYNNNNNNNNILMGQGLLIIEDSRSHSIRHSTLVRSPLDE